MPLGDFGALSIFGIQCRSAESVLKDHVRHSEWKTEYFGDSGRQVVGVSTSVGSKWLNEEMVFSQWETRYYDETKVRTLGISISVGKNYCRENLSFLEWETTYYAADRATVLCNSTSLIEGERFSQINTRYYKGTLCSSHSVGSEWLYTMGFRKWETTYDIPELFVRLALKEKETRDDTAQRARDVADERSRQEYWRMRQAQEEARTKRLEKVTAARERIKISELKTYYVARAGFFNASSEVFKSGDRSEVLKALENRARNNPGGASDKTLKRFDLKLG